MVHISLRMFIVHGQLQQVFSWPVRKFCRLNSFSCENCFPGGLRNSCSAVRRSINPAHQELSFGRRVAWREVLPGPGVVETRQC